VKLDVTPGLVTADVNGERVVLAAPPIPAGIWSAVDVSSPTLAQTLEHTWEEQLWPDGLTAVGSPAGVAAVRERLEAEPALLLRWRGYGDGKAGGDEWRGAELPSLPESNRRLPDSVPKRLGRSGIGLGGGDLVEALGAVYRSF
jgi:hypothetical protein